MIVDGVFIATPDDSDPERFVQIVCRNPGRAYERLKELVESSPFHELERD